MSLDPIASLSHWPQCHKCHIFDIKDCPQRSSLVAQQVKEPVLSLLWHRFNPLTWELCRCGQKKKIVLRKWSSIRFRIPVSLPAYVGTEVILYFGNVCISFTFPLYKFCVMDFQMWDNIQQNFILLTVLESSGISFLEINKWQLP